MHSGGVRQTPGKKLRNKLTSARGLAEVAVEGYELDPHTAANIIPLLNQRLPNLLNSVLAGVEQGGKPKDVKRIREGLDGDFIQSAVDAIARKDVTGWRIVMGLGGAEVLPSYRLLGVVREAFLLAERISVAAAEYGIPKVRFIKAAALANRVNGGDLSVMNEIGEITFRFIGDYVRRFHPRFIDRVEFLLDSPLAVDDLLQDVVAPMEKKVGDLPEIEKLGEGRSGPTGSRMYALAHAFQLEAVTPIEPRRYQQWNKPVPPSRPDCVIIIGGAAERFFLKPIQLAVENAPSDKFARTRRLHIVLQSGEKPGYFPYPDEPAIGSGLTPVQAYALEEISGHVGDDWKRLLRDVNYAEDIIDFCGGWRI